jgi:hypothetical protein
MEEIWHKQGVDVDIRDKESSALREFALEKLSGNRTNSSVNSKHKSPKMR